MTAVAHENEGQRKGIAMGVSIALHALLILFFILYKIITPIPPFPEKGGGSPGYELALGFSDLGMGNNQDATDAITPAAPQESATPPEELAEVLTNEADESAVTAPPKPVEKPHTDKPKPDRPKLTEEEIRRNKQKEIDALMNNKGGGAEGRGTSTTPGTSGVPNGSPTGGGGGGQGIYGLGQGIGYELGNRTARHKPDIKEKPNKAGKIVMDIWVDRDGKVIRTAQNTARSTTLDQELVSIARTACLSTTFSPDFRANTGAEQKGAMIFIFELE